MGAEIAGAVAAAVVGAALAPKPPKIPDAPPPVQPPQASKAPDMGIIQKQLAGTGQAGGAPGIGQTMLTGPGGVNPGQLTLGKNTLLGG